MNKPHEAKWLISGGGLPNEYAVCNRHYDEPLKALRAKGIIRVDAIVDPVDCMATPDIDIDELSEGTE